LIHNSTFWFKDFLLEFCKSYSLKYQKSIHSKKNLP